MSYKSEPEDEEVDFEEIEVNRENEQRLGALTESISRLKHSALYLDEKVDKSTKDADGMLNEMDDLMDFVYGTQEKLKKLFNTTSTSHMFVLVIGGILILVVVYLVVFKL
ncbi:t-SNARE coiled-coil-like proteiny domain-containing protein [Entamoeba marina]